MTDDTIPVPRETLERWHRWLDGAPSGLRAQNAGNIRLEITALLSEGEEETKEAESER